MFGGTLGADVVVVDREAIGWKVGTNSVNELLTCSALRRNYCLGCTSAECKNEFRSTSWAYVVQEVPNQAIGWTSGLQTNSSSCEEVPRDTAVAGLAGKAKVGANWWDGCAIVEG